MGGSYLLLFRLVFIPTIPPTAPQIRPIIKAVIALEPKLRDCENRLPTRHKRAE